MGEGGVEPHFLICLGNAHRPSIRQEYTPHHLASRIHDPGLWSGDPTLSGPISASAETIVNHKADLGTSCLSASSTMTLQRTSYLQAHPASGETIANHKADLGTSCLSASLTMTPQRRSDTVRTGICIGRNGSRLLPRIATLFRAERVRQEGAGKW